MAALYNFGLSQEDPLTEIKGMDLTDGDSLLCIAGAGDFPLSVTALKNVTIVAVDVSANQLYLCRLKQQAATLPDPGVAAGFMGYTVMNSKTRRKLFHQKIAPFLPGEDVAFWQKNIRTIGRGVIHEGKFERFIGKASMPARMIIGKRNFSRLFECNSTKEQEEVFDRYFANRLLKIVFKTVFHPGIYQNRGIDSAGMQHRQEGNIGDFFFGRFRSFCCSTPARDNFLLQYVFFRKSLFPSAIPEYLKPENHAVFLRNQHQVSYVPCTMESFLSQVQPGQFNKIQLSNIGDWMHKEAMAGLFNLIQEKTNPGSRVVLRFIYLDHPVPETVSFLKPDHESGKELLRTDRFPFSSVVPIKHVKHEQLPNQAY